VPYLYTKKNALLTKIFEVGAFIFLLPVTCFNRKRNPGSKKILLVEPFQMGDVLSLTPLIQPLLSKFPAAEIFVLTKKSSGSILEFDSRIKGIIKLDFSWSDYGVKTNKLNRLIKVARETIKLRRYKFDLGLDTRGDIRSQILMTLAGCRQRVGYLNYLHSNINVKGLLLTHQLEKSRHMHRYQWNLELLSVLGWSEADLFPVKFPSFVPDRITIGAPSSDHTVVHIGGGWQYKRWDELKWIELIHQLTRQWAEDIIVIAGPGEKDVIDRIELVVSNSGYRHRVKFRITSLEEMIVLIHQCNRFIGLDSGPMNVAVCLNKKVVALFGPGDSTMWSPLNEGAKFIHKKEKFPCNPCHQITCLFPSKSCMEEIEVSDVLSELANS